MVGEDEPELFVPGRSGVIMNQDQLRAALNGTNLTTDSGSVDTMMRQIDRYLQAQPASGVVTGDINITTTRPEQTATEVVRGLRRASWLAG